MNSKLLKLLTVFAAQTGLSLDPRSSELYGRYNGIEVCISQLGTSAAFRISAAVKRGDSTPDINELKAIAMQNKKYLAAASSSLYRVRFNVKPALSLTAAVNSMLRPALEIVTGTLSQLGYENCCQACGTAEGVGTYYLRMDSARLCENCYQSCSAENDNLKFAEEQKTENVIGGTVGALLGSIIGGAAIVAIGQLGFVAVLSGIIMGVCALKGYEILGGKLSRRGIVISSVIMFIMVLISHHIDLSFSFMREMNKELSSAGYSAINVFESSRYLIELFKSGYITIGNLLPNLILLLIFTAAGAVPIVYSSINSKKSLNVCYRLDAPENGNQAAPAASSEIPEESMPAAESQPVSAAAESYDPPISGAEITAEPKNGE